jgi:hypothetical protein
MPIIESAFMKMMSERLLLHMLQHFEYQIVSFDLINTSVIFQVYINHVSTWSSWWFLHCLSWWYSCFLQNQRRALSTSRACYQVLTCAELYANLKKYEFFKTEVKYLDFLINKNSLHINSLISRWSLINSSSLKNLLWYLSFYWVLQLLLTIYLQLALHSMSSSSTTSWHEKR